MFSKKIKWSAIANIYTNMYMSEDVYYISDSLKKNYHKP